MRAINTDLHIECLDNLDYETFWIKENENSVVFIERNRLLFEYLDEYSVGAYSCVAVPKHNARIGSARLKIMLKLDENDENKMILSYIEYETDPSAKRISKTTNFTVNKAKIENREKKYLTSSPSSSSSTPQTTTNVFNRKEMNEINENSEIKIIKPNDEDDNIDVMDTPRPREVKIENRDLTVYVKNPKKSFIQIGESVELFCVTNYKSKYCK
jgi:hypothetical protein